MKIIKDIPGYEGLYAVTKDGRIWSFENVVEMRIRGGKLNTSPLTT